MSFNIPHTVKINTASNSIIKAESITLHSGITTLLGPNASGKTQLLLEIKKSLKDRKLKVKYLSAGRLGPLESYRSNYDGNSSHNIDENVNYGSPKKTQYRHDAETIMGSMQTLSERYDVFIKIKEILEKLYGRNIKIYWYKGLLKASFCNLNDENENENYASSRESSGLLHLVALLSSLYDDEIDAVIIDEPEVSLHPQLQSFIYQEIKKVSGFPTGERNKIVILATHSTQFITLNTPKDLCSIVFCHGIETAPVQISPDQKELKEGEIRKLIKKIGYKYKMALFCKSPLMVEGDSDELICAALNEKLSLNIEGAGSQILPVGGKPQMTDAIKLMRLIGKSPVILGDADVFADGLKVINGIMNNSEALSIVEKNEATELVSKTYSKFKTGVIDKWDKISSIITNCPNYDSSIKCQEIAQKRAAFTWIMTAEHAMINDTNVPGLENIKEQMDNLFSFLNKIGIFILKKGTIEEYYHQTKNKDKPHGAENKKKLGKIDLALEEANQIWEAEEQSIRERYSDVIEAIQFATKSVEINEAKAIKSSLNRVIFTALDSIDKSETFINKKVKSEINHAEANLFDIKKEVIDDEICLVFSLKSKILDIKGFPVTKRKEDKNDINIYPS
jgi:hypothetical protein